MIIDITRGSRRRHSQQLPETVSSAKTVRLQRWARFDVAKLDRKIWCIIARCSALHPHHVSCMKSCKALGTLSMSDASQHAGAHLQGTQTTSVAYLHTLLRARERKYRMKTKEGLLPASWFPSASSPASTSTPTSSMGWRVRS